MKLIARVQQVVKTAIHTIGTVRDGKVVPVEDLPLPDRVIIEKDPESDECMMYRYTKAGEFCGDTWHEDLEGAYAQAGYEYGLTQDDFVEVIDGGPDA